MLNCSVCETPFKPKNSLQHVCFDDMCRKENSRRTMNAWKHKTGRADPNSKNWWTEEDVKFLENNRYLSTKEISDAIGRSVESVKEKRYRLGLPRLADCVTCGVTFKRINQHNQCEDCTPDQKGYAVDYRNSLNGRWQMYKNNADKRSISFDLTVADFSALWSQACSYCGGDIETIGLDRIDNAKGYTMDNVVSCCGRCNEMKMGESADEWLSHMKKILRHLEVAQ